MVGEQYAGGTVVVTQSWHQKDDPKAVPMVFNHRSEPVFEIDSVAGAPAATDTVCHHTKLSVG